MTKQCPFVYQIDLSALPLAGDCEERAKDTGHLLYKQKLDVDKTNMLNLWNTIYLVYQIKLSALPLACDCEERAKGCWLFT